MQGHETCSGSGQSSQCKILKKQFYYYMSKQNYKIISNQIRRVSTASIIASPQDKHTHGTYNKRLIRSED